MSALNCALGREEPLDVRGPLGARGAGIAPLVGGGATGFGAPGFNAGTTGAGAVDPRGGGGMPMEEPQGEAPRPRALG